jgi:hypothetical protein
MPANRLTRHLRQGHRAEFSYADEPDADRPVGITARGKHGLQIYVFVRAVPSRWFSVRGVSM